MSLRLESLANYIAALIVIKNELLARGNSRGAKSSNRSVQQGNPGRTEKASGLTWWSVPFQWDLCRRRKGFRC